MYDIHGISKIQNLKQVYHFPAPKKNPLHVFPSNKIKELQIHKLSPTTLRGNVGWIGATTNC